MKGAAAIDKIVGVEFEKLNATHIQPLWYCYRQVGPSEGIAQFSAQIKEFWWLINTTRHSSASILHLLRIKLKANYAKSQDRTLKVIWKHLIQDQVSGAWLISIIHSSQPGPLVYCRDDSNTYGKMPKMTQTCMGNPLMWIAGMWLDVGRETD